MIFFRVTNNINIKTTDGTLVKYFRFKAPASLPNETVYLTTYDDFEDLKVIFARIDKSKYIPKLLNEENVRLNESFPKELGISYKYEFNKALNKRDEEFIELKETDLYKQIKYVNKDEVKVAVIGGFGASISKIISSSPALRILYENLSEVYKSVKIDLYINASNNSYFTRDKELYKTQEYINEILPLSLNTKTLSEYDFFIDNSVDITSLVDLPVVDAWLFKFGIDYKKVPENKKFINLNIADFNIDEKLVNKIKTAKAKGKLILYHPYSANIEKSIPQSFASEYLKELLLKYDDCTIVTTLQIDSKVKGENLLELAVNSRTINDFIYIVSSVDEIITTDTSTLHIADAFMIPTVAIFTDPNYMKKIKYYHFVKPIFIEDRSKNLSKFIYENDILTINKFESWRELKVKQIMKLLESF